MPYFKKHFGKFSHKPKFCGISPPPLIERSREMVKNLLFPTPILPKIGAWGNFENIFFGFPTIELGKKKLVWTPIQVVTEIC